MKALKTILFPTDFSDDAAKAYTYALKTAERTGAELHFIHAIEEPLDFATRHKGSEDRLQAQAYEQIKKEIEKAKKKEKYQEIASKSHVIPGKPYAVINQKADELDADLIFMGTKGESKH